MESGGCAVAPCTRRASFCWGNSDVRENASGVVTPLGRLCNSFWQGGGCHVPSRPIVAEPRKCWRIHKNDGIVSILSGGREHAIFFSGKASVGLSDRRIDRRRPPHDPRGGPARHGTWGRADSRPRVGHRPRGQAEGPGRRAEHGAPLARSAWASANISRAAHTRPGVRQAGVGGSAPCPGQAGWVPSGRGRAWIQSGLDQVPSSDTIGQGLPWTMVVVGTSRARAMRSREQRPP